MNVATKAVWKGMLHGMLTILLCSIVYQARADHITGGEMSYTSAPAGDGRINYFFTLKLFMRCNSGRQFNNPTVVSVFSRSTNARVVNVTVPLSSQETQQLGNAGPCITNPPTVCYVIGTYNFTIPLDASADGYLVTSQVNYRISGISNLMVGYSNIGATYTCEIPGNQQNGATNNSAKFTGSDLVVVCANNRFAYSFGATDPDGDRLKYSFCNAYASGTSFGSNNTTPPDPPYPSVPYGNGFAGNEPLGPFVKIDENSGMITGIAPPTGVYVVTVCVQEIRNGTLIATQRKDLQINIASCDIAAALLEPEYQLCRATTFLSLFNKSTSNLINTQQWRITNAGGQVLKDTTGTNLQYNFTDTGLFTIKLVINRGQACTDSTTSLVRVYPGFQPAFTYTGVCFNRPTVFTNQTITRYGSIAGYSWKLGEPGNPANLPATTNPTITYQTMGNKLAELTAINTNGCVDTAVRVIPIFEKPPLSLAFKDTLMCIKDSVQLLANGSGNFTWQPTTAMSNAASATPTVAPQVNTRYYVELNDQGCINRDSVLVRVTDKVNLQMMGDTLICRGDSITLRMQTNGFRFAWTPANLFANATARNPTVSTTVPSAAYQVQAFIGSCVATGTVNVTTVPYPQVSAGADTMLCYNTAGQLKGSTNGTSFQWLPAIHLSNSNSLQPVANPPATTTYVLAATDTRGCPKPAYDTVVVAVLPPINAFAGNDTAVVIGEPLQLNASGGTRYQWIPADDLSNGTIANPVARFGAPSPGHLYNVLVYNQAGCVDTASLVIKVFSTKPSVFVPTAFSPNGDGLNDLLRPVAAGIRSIKYFTVFNRWGKMVYSTNQNGKGWDGTLNGTPQASGTFVWMVDAIDYLGTPFRQKGTVVLIR